MKHEQNKLYTPKIIHAAKALVLSRTGRLLMGLTATQQWELIGGTSEPNEVDTRVTLVREFAEETFGGCLVPTRLWRRTVSHDVTKNKLWFVDFYTATIRYTGRRRMLVPANAELRAIRFLSEEDILHTPDIMFRHDHKQLALEFLRERRLN